MALLKKYEINEQPSLPAFLRRFKSFDHDDFTVKHCYFGCSRLPDIDGMKFCDKDNQVLKYNHE